MIGYTQCRNSILVLILEIWRIYSVIFNSYLLSSYHEPDKQEDILSFKVL